METLSGIFTADNIFWLLNTPVVKWLILILALVMPLASLLTWAERRQSAMMQDRLGPNRANIGPVKLWGILHFVADALKMISKEDTVPGNAHRPLFNLAPILALAPVFIAFSIIPFGPTIFPHDLFTVRYLGVGLNDSNAIDLQVFKVDYGLLFYFAILTLANYGATLAGWSSYNKWALLGGLRASSQMMSYEVSMGLSLMGVFLVMGTLEPSAMVAWQGPNPLYWGVTVSAGVAFVLFFTASIAETKRGPFDLPEGEPEIIGYFVEYSGMRFGMFFLAEFVEIVFLSSVISTVFFAGWHFPFLYDDGFRFGSYWLPLQHWGVTLIRIAAFGGKVMFFCWLQLAIRWTLPRFRPDQLMTLGWKWLLPLSLCNLMAVAGLSLWLQRPPVPPHAALSKIAYQCAKKWPDLPPTEIQYDIKLDQDGKPTEVNVTGAPNDEVKKCLVDGAMDERFKTATSPIQMVVGFRAR